MPIHQSVNLALILLKFDTCIEQLEECTGQFTRHQQVHWEPACSEPFYTETQRSCIAAMIPLQPSVA